MNKYLISLLLALGVFSSSLFASMPLQKSMLQIVNGSNHVLSVNIIGVDMIDEEGNQITDPNAKTGPGLKNQIRLISKVTKVHHTNSKKVPDEIRVPLDSFMHYSLGQISKYYKDRTVPALFVLKGKDYHPVFAGLFQFPQHELETIMALYTLKKN